MGGRRYRILNKFKPFDSNTICDETGFKKKLSETLERWDGFRVIPEAWNPQQPQDFAPTLSSPVLYPEASSESSYPPLWGESGEFSPAVIAANILGTSGYSNYFSGTANFIGEATAELVQGLTTVSTLQLNGNVSYLEFDSLGLDDVTVLKFTGFNKQPTDKFTVSVLVNLIDASITDNSFLYWLTNVQADNSNGLNSSIADNTNGVEPANNTYLDVGFESNQFAGTAVAIANKSQWFVMTFTWDGVTVAGDQIISVFFNSTKLVNDDQDTNTLGAWTDSLIIGAETFTGTQYNNGCRCRVAGVAWADDVLTDVQIQNAALALLDSAGE